MNMYAKYPQTSKKQHKQRHSYKPDTTIAYLKPSETSNRHIGIFVTQSYVLPKRYVSYIRKHFRKFFKKRHVRFWFYIQPNYLITSKSKNSRMGKGVGTINRVAFKVGPKAPTLVLSNISVSRVLSLSRLLSMRLSIPLSVKIL